MGASDSGKPPTALKGTAGAKAKEVAPGSAAQGVQQAQRLARENPAPLAFVGVFVAGVVLGRRLSR